MSQRTQTRTLERTSSGNAPLANFLVIQATSVFERIGGIEFYLDDLASDLSEALGTDHVTVLYPSRDPKTQVEPKNYAAKAVPFRLGGLLGKLQNRFSWRLWNTALNLIQNSRPTHLICAHVSLAPFTYLLSLRTGLPYTTITYGIEAWGERGYLEEFALAQSDSIITISHWTQKILQQRGYPAHQISVVHPRLPTEFENIPFTRTPRPKNEPLRLITVSRLDPFEQYKGQDHVLEALARIAATERVLPFEYHIVGAGADLGRLQALARKLKLEDFVHFHTDVQNRKELIQLYRGGDVYVMPSRFGKWDGRWRGEGFGIVYLEAAACGLPSIAYNCGGATDIIQHDYNGFLVEPDDIGELSRLFWTLHQRRERIVEMGKAAHKDVTERWGRTAIRAEIFAWLRDLESSED